MRGASFLVINSTKNSIIECTQVNHRTRAIREAGKAVNDRRMNHDVWSRRSAGPDHFSMSKTFLCVQMSAFDI